MTAPENAEFRAEGRKLFPWFLNLYILFMILHNSFDGAYTDGILQLTVFQNQSGLYPPLYGLLSHLVPFLTLEQAAVVVSGLGYVLTVSMVFRHGGAVIGYRASRIAALLIAVSPLAVRWSMQVMADTAFMAFSTVAMFFLTEAWTSLRTHARSRSHKFLAWAVAFGALATLTRYQGALLAPLLALVFILFIRRFRAVPWGAIIAGLLWLLVPAWMWYNGFVHQDQFAQRTAGSSLANFFAAWNTFESFVLISPYYFGYPIFAAAVAGLFYFRKVARPWYARPAAVLWGAYAIMLLVLQARFGSVQYRYMLPLLPMIALLAGAGFRWLEEAFAHRPWVPRWALILSMIYLVFFSLCVIFLQKRPYADQYDAAQFIKEQVPVSTPIYSNERYGNFTNLGSVKLSFWSGRPVKPLLSPDQPMEPGSVLVLGNAYGGNEALVAMLDALSQQYELQPLISEPYQSQIVPLMDDIMVNPMFNQNPMGWVMRYVPQRFATNIYRVMPLGAGTVEAARGR